jgi:hypothetical protein
VEAIVVGPRHRHEGSDFKVAESRPSFSAKVHRSRCNSHPKSPMTDLVRASAVQRNDRKC